MSLNTDTSSKMLIVYTFFTERAEADGMATALIEQRLAACVQVMGPVSSAYRWEGELQREEEYQLSAKVLAEHYPELASYISGHHSYEVPAVIAVPIHAVNEAYLEWAKRQCV